MIRVVHQKEQQICKPYPLHIILTILIYIFNMNPIITEIKNAADGLMFISESDNPFEVISFDKPGSKVADHLKTLVKIAPDADPEIQTPEYFFRNMTRVNDGGDNKISAERFKALQSLLQHKLKNVQVYRFGTVQVHAFIIGELPDGSYDGLRTLLIET